MPKQAQGHRADRRLSIVGQMRWIVALLIAILLGILGTVVFEVHGIRVDLRRVAEERREAELAQALVLDTRGFERVVHLRASVRASADEGLGAADQLGHIDGALAALERMADAPQDDPSLASHQATEARTRAQLRDLLQRARKATETGEVDTSEWRAHALSMRRFAEALALEVGREAHAASVDLDTRGGSLMRLVGLLAAGALLLLFAICTYISRGVVRPLLALREGAKLIGRGQLEHPLTEAGGAEVRDLSREIKAMARQLASHHRELTDRVEQRTRELIRTARFADLGAVAAGLAHEINTPLASISACAEGLLRRAGNGAPMPAGERDYLETIAQEADRVRDIAARLLEVGRVDASVLGPVDVADAVRAAVTLSRHRFASRGVDLEVDVEVELPSVRSNPQELRQILLNLLNNALDASPPSSRVVVRAQRVGAEVVIDVDDEGSGVSAELVDRVFEPFYTTKEVGHGTGLGLAIVQRILEQQGGHIEVSDRAPGARFRVRLPVMGDDQSPRPAASLL